jgi:hypothetical protein
LLQEKGVAFTILNPVASKGFAKSFLSTTKIDKSDAKVL